MIFVIGCWLDRINDGINKKGVHPISPHCKTKWEGFNRIKCLTKQSSPLVLQPTEEKYRFPSTPIPMWSIAAPSEVRCLQDSSKFFCWLPSETLWTFSSQMAWRISFQKLKAQLELWSISSFRRNWLIHLALVKLYTIVAKFSIKFLYLPSEN